MRIMTFAVGLLALLFSTSVQAVGADGTTCRAAVRSKAVCMGTRPNTPARTACFKAAMQRCKQNGTGAI